MNDDIRLAKIMNNIEVKFVLVCIQVTVSHTMPSQAKSSKKQPNRTQRY